ncbi:MAG: hypothetical protein RBG13Loki_0860 [Promethearchaeota archaeon CR_4]|nr:MAG: hypothetical protein RBG13Loki_0860 [Candidatus Lokiarchaeota archaeon CR_4]
MRVITSQADMERIIADVNGNDVVTKLTSNEIAAARAIPADPYVEMGDATAVVALWIFSR